MRQINLVILLAALTLLSSKCGDDDCEVVPGGKKYNARVPVTYSPMQERFKVGDTISVEVYVLSELKDTLSGESLPMDEVTFEGLGGGDIRGVIARYIKTQQDSTKWIYAAKEFDYIQQKGTVQVIGGAVSALAVTFSSEADKKTAIFKLVPLRSGIYSLAFDSPYLDVSGKIGHYCGATLNLHFGDSVAHNYHLLQEFDVKKVGTYQENIGVFIFAVEE